MIPLVKPYIPEREVLMPELEKILYSGYIAEGEAVYQFEAQFSKFIGNPFSLAVHAGTDALHLALLLAGVKPGDEVISTAMTAEPTNTTIAMTGARVVWGDVNPRNGLLDPFSVRSLINERTKAIVVVHYAGMVCDMEEFNRIAHDFKIPVIEDAAHALGAKFNGQLIGSNSPYTLFSLQAIKHVTTVDGGFLCVGNQKDYEKARLKRWFGLDKTKSRLENDISNGKYYDEHLKNISGVELVEYSKNTEASYWLYTMKVERREDFIKMMESEGITVSPLHHRNDTHSIFAASRRELPGLEEFYSRLIHIPCGWWVSGEERERIVSCIKRGW